MNVIKKMGARGEEATAVKPRRTKSVVPASYEKARYDQATVYKLLNYEVREHSAVCLMARPREQAISVWVEQLSEQLLVGRDYSVVNLVKPDEDENHGLGCGFFAYGDELRQVE